MICRPATLEDQLSNVHPADLHEPVWSELDDYPPCLPVTFWRGALWCLLFVLAAFAGACVFLF